MAEIDQAALEAVQDDIAALAEATEKAEFEIAKKRYEVMTPIFEKRREIVAEIPGFWSTVLQNHMATTELLSESDRPVLEHLTDVWVKHDPKDIRNYEIVFTFKENPYFGNKELIKKIIVKDDEPTTEVFKIDWKEGKDVTLKDPSKKRKSGADDAANAADSFFSWFADEDASLANFFVQEVFPDALNIYANEDDEDFDDDEEIDDDQSVDLDDEEDEEEEEEEKPKKKSKK